MKYVTVIYPSKDGAKFDFEYYLSKHIPMVAGLLGARIEVSRGIGTPDGTPHGTPLAFLCAARIRIDSVEEYAAALDKHGAKILGDIPNYTNITPIVQLEEVIREQEVPDRGVQSEGN
jgi:uncharacterized protein (TIGR02118 family)